MMERTTNSPDSGIALEATEWLIELGDGAPERIAEFTAWLKASPRHIEEFLLASAIWQELDQVDPERRIQVEALIAETRSGVVELTGSGALMPVPTAATARGPWRQRIALAGFALAASLVGVWLVNPALLGGPEIYHTAKGEQRVVKLADGSIAHLNTDTKLAVQYTEVSRELSLRRGEALFVVEHDALRPFVVTTDVAAVRALGTQFDVYRREDGTTVSVLQGVVEVREPERNAVLRAVMPGVEDGPAAAVPAQLAAGEQAVVASRGVLARSTASDAVAQAVAWRERRLVFRGDTLLEVAREFNRYNERPIVIEEQSIGRRELTGVFDADDPGSLLLFLSKDPELALEERRDAVVVRAAAIGRGDSGNEPPAGP